MRSGLLFKANGHEDKTRKRDVKSSKKGFLLPTHTKKKAEQLQTNNQHGYREVEQTPRAVVLWGDGRHGVGNGAVSVVTM